MFWEVSQGLYNACLIPLSFLFSSILLDLISLAVVSTSFIWITQPAFTTENLVSLYISLGCIFICYKLLTMTMFAVVRHSYLVLKVTVLVASLSSMISSGYLKWDFTTIYKYYYYNNSTYTSFRSYQSANDAILPWLTTVCPERFANVMLQYQFVNGTKVLNCHRNELVPFQNETDFCRWKSGSEYLTEVLTESTLPPESWQGIAIAGITGLITIGAFFTVTSKKAVTMLWAK